ncbi:hypothetical protein PBMFNG_PBMFNG_12045, partial [Dysosmobacter welbionis]
LQLLNRGQGRRDADIAVLGILAIGEGSACAGHGDARLLAQGQRPLGGAG